VGWIFSLYEINERYLKYLKILWIDYIKCVLTFHEYVVRVTIIFQCVLLIQLIAWEDEWFIAIEILEEGNKKIKKAAKNKREGKKL
jgi:hypothetical protein